MDDPNVRFRRRMSMPNLDPGASPGAADVTRRLYAELPDEPPRDELGIIDPRLAFRPVWAPGGSAVALLIARIAAAGVFAWGVTVQNPVTGMGGFGTWAEAGAHNHPVAVYRMFAEGVLVPNATVFAWLQFLLEALLALSLLAGALVGLTGLLATLWAAFIALGSWKVVPQPDYVGALLVAIPLVVWVTRAGRYYGIDGFLRPLMLSSRSRPLQWIAARLM